MIKEQTKKWLEDTVSDAFMDMFYYNRKGDEEMSLDNLKELLEIGVLDKEMMIEVFTKQIEKEFES